MVLTKNQSFLKVRRINCHISVDCGGGPQRKEGVGVQRGGGDGQQPRGRTGAPHQDHPPHRQEHHHQASNKDKDRRKGKVRHFFLGGRIYSISCRASCLAKDGFE